MDDRSLQKLNRLVLSACQSDPQARFASATEMLAELSRAEPPTPERSFRHRLWLGVGAGCLLPVAMFAVAYQWTGRVEQVKVNFITEPFEATIQVDGVLLVKPDRTPYRTPCTVPDLSARIHGVVFRLPSLPDLDIGRVDFAGFRDIEAHWESKPAP